MDTATGRPNPMPLVLANPPGLYDPAPNGYSHIAMVAPGSRLILIAGQGGEDEAEMLSPDFRAQVRQALRNLQIALTAAGVAFGDVAKLTVLIVDHDHDKLKIFGSELQRAWASNALKPACTLIPVVRLALDGMLFEIEATAIAAA